MTGFETNDKRTLGKSGEHDAGRFLASQGFAILERNFRCGRYGEIDIIAFRDGLLVFAEVKTRTGAAYGGSLYSITKKKMASLKKNPAFFLFQNAHLNAADVVCRFDLISVSEDGIEWVRDIIR
jgi:putative endonuclease